MLQASFQHFAGISARREGQLWRRGIASWTDFEQLNARQMLLFGCNHYADAVNESRSAFERGDVEYFARRLPRAEHYRIVYAFPDQTLFLDIESTGLSLFYDRLTLVGWCFGAHYHSHIQGDQPDALLEAISRAKALITFNGARFDVPFILQEFPKASFPPVHVDLRFFARRAGIGGPQKEIEQQIGVARDPDLGDIDGKAATVLWHEYCRGDLDALRRLIRYNHADIEGMKAIFDVAAYRLLDRSDIPDPVRPGFRFASQRSGIAWPVQGDAKTGTVKLPRYRGKAGPTLIFDDLCSENYDRGELTAIGIDLTGSSRRPSGWCALRGSHAETSTLETDEEIMTATLEANPHLVSIDSPLSLPDGRTSVADDDPSRERCGIMRWCERELRRRGVHVYPCLIPSMQRLTERGIRLASQLRKAGIPVIESYPGAAQDILRIPRKGTSLRLLQTGLREFGLTGPWIDCSEVSHDELDAITSALVGLFWWHGRFEALGNEKEDYLIIPSLDPAHNGWGQHRAVGLSGKIAAGKTTAALLLRNHGYEYGRFSQVLAQTLHSTGRPVNRRTLQELGARIHHDPGQRWLCHQLLAGLPGSTDVVIDGLRHPEDHAAFMERFGPRFLHLHLDAPARIRAVRYGGDFPDDSSFQAASDHPVEANVPLLSRLAHGVIRNHDTLDSLEKQLLSTITRLCTR